MLMGNTGRGKTQKTEPVIKGPFMSIHVIVVGYWIGLNKCLFKIYIIGNVWQNKAALFSRYQNNLIATNISM